MPGGMGPEAHTRVLLGSVLAPAPVGVRGGQRQAGGDTWRPCRFAAWASRQPSQSEDQADRLVPRGWWHIRIDFFHFPRDRPFWTGNLPPDALESEGGAVRNLRATPPTPC
jgi:hypothetical protein